MGLIRKLRALWHSEKLSADIDDELQFHLAMREELNRRNGMRDGQAGAMARRSFGNAAALKEATREADLPVFLETVLKDVRFAARMLAKQPAFTALAVFALAIGIGVNTAVFTACKAILFQPLDAKDPRQIVNVYRVTAQGRYSQIFSYPDFEAFRNHNRVFTGLVATTGGELVMTDSAGPANSGSAANSGLARAFGFHLASAIGGASHFVSVASVSENYFAVLGVNAVRGRVFLPQDAHELDLHPAILVSENFWRLRFASYPSVLGKTAKLNGTPFTIIGITPRDFVGTVINVPNIWIPMRLWPLASKNANVLEDREETCCALYGRLAPGVSLQQAQAEMTRLEAHVRPLHAPHSEASTTASISLTPGSHLGPVLVLGGGELVFSLMLILGAVGLVLLIACANVGSLQLSRSAARQKEIGVRLSIGASRGRIIRQLLTESALLGLIAGGFSLLATWCALRLLMLGIAASLPVEWGSVALHVAPDLGVFAYVFVLSLFASVLFGLAPALQSSRPALSAALKEEGSGLALRISGSRTRAVLMGTQAAASLFLLIAAALLIRGSIRSLTRSPGYETKRVLSLDLAFPPGFGYDHAKQLAELRQLHRGIAANPVVRSVSAGIAPDGGGLRTAAVGVNGNQPSRDATARTIFYSYVEPNYFECVGIPMVAGRVFPGSAAAPEPSAVLSESAAEELWPGENPIGKKLALDASNQFYEKSQLIPRGAIYQVIGIARNTRAITPQGDDNRKAYLPLPTDRLDGGFPLLVRFEGDPNTIIAAIREQLHAVDPNLVVNASTLEDLLTATPTFVIPRLASIFATLIGGLGLILACVGIYGTVSYAVVRRTREVGIRMALGAQKRAVLRLVVFESARPVLAGLMVGMVAAAVFLRLLNSILFGLGSADPASFLGVTALFLVIALLAAYFPARRAAQVDPTVALRCD